ncbi:MAG: ATP-binding cassette domain-containing protein [bacterium]
MKVEARGCSYRYQHCLKGHEYALSGICLEVLPSQISGIVGVNGAGKSTLANLLAGLSKPSEGTILADGKNIYASKTVLAAYRKAVALVPQFPEDQFFTGSLYQELSFGLERCGIDREIIHRKIGDTIRELGLNLDEESLVHRSPFELGGGEKRLISLAAALIMEPKILILDEPTAGLDIMASQRIWNLIHGLRQRFKLSIIVISHEVEKLALLVDRLIVVHQGKIACQGTPYEVFAKPTDLLSFGLELPQITVLGYNLELLGIKPDHRPIFEVDEAAALIKKWFTGTMKAH